MKLTHYSDPAHGWLKVPKTLIEKYGISGEITTWSYIRKDFVYLEEDCDARLFLSAAKRSGDTYVIVERHTNRSSKIRSYQQYPIK